MAQIDAPSIQARTLQHRHGLTQTMAAGSDQMSWTLPPPEGDDNEDMVLIRAMCADSVKAEIARRNLKPDAPRQPSMEEEQRWLQRALPPRARPWPPPPHRALVSWLNLFQELHARGWRLGGGAEDAGIQTR